MMVKRFIPLSLSLRAGLFILMFLAVLMIGARVYDVALQVSQGKTAVLAPVNAEENKPEDVKPDEKKAEDPKPEEARADENKPEDSKGDPAKMANSPEEKKEDKTAGSVSDAAPPAVDDPNYEAPELSESEINVLKHLSDRRKELEKRKTELDQRETLLNLTEQRVDKKMTDLKQMQEAIRKTLGQADAEHMKQVASMVKIYETMKPKDAAKIFGDMDMPTLVEVVSRMKEAKAAPILAAMDAEKAKQLSTALMTKKDLPPPP